jgi:hypothetical protein
MMIGVTVTGTITSYCDHDRKRDRGSARNLNPSAKPGGAGGVSVSCHSDLQASVPAARHRRPRRCPGCRASPPGSGSPRRPAAPAAGAGRPDRGGRGPGPGPRRGGRRGQESAAASRSRS